MGEVIRLGATAREVVQTAAPVRQPGELAEPPASQFVRVGTIARNLLKRLEREMNERAITLP